MDLASAYSAVRDLPDSALHKEMQTPSGMLPQYLVVGELSDRQSIRGGSGNPKPPTIKEQIMQRLQSQPQAPTMPMMNGGPPPVPGYSRGGMIGQINPFATMAEGMRNPDLAAGMAQEALNSANGGLMPLDSPQAPGQPGTPFELGALNPLPAGDPASIDSGGLATLLRTR